MKVFAPSKRKLIEILIMIGLAGIFYFFYPKSEGVILFIFGFIWNWSASIELDPIYQQKRYKFSMLNTVRSIQLSFLKPFRKLPYVLQRVLAVLPAGIFWWMVISLNESIMPSWATFIGSAAFELVSIEISYIKSQQEKV